MPDLPPFEEKPIPWWQKSLATTVFVLAGLLIGLGWGRFLADFWPIDNSRVGPNLTASIVQWAIVLISAALLWPPTRRRIHHFVTRHMAPLHEHFAEAKAQRERHHAEQMAAHADHAALIHHVIRHSANIPAYNPDTPIEGGDDMAKKSPARREARTAKATPTVTKKATAKVAEPEVTKKATRKGTK